MTERSGQAAARLRNGRRDRRLDGDKYGAEQLLPVNRADKGEKRFGERVWSCRRKHEDRSAQSISPVFHSGFSWIDLIDRQDMNGNTVLLSFQCSRQ